MHTFAVVALGSSVALAQPAAHAIDAESSQPSPAADEFWQANDLYAHGQYASAIELYERVFAVTGESAVLFNIAQSYRKLSDCPNARQAVGRYLERETHPPIQIEQWLAGLEAQCPSTQKSVAPAQPPEGNPAVLTPVAASAEPDPAAPAIADASASFSVRRTAGWSLVGAAVVAAGASVYFAVQVQRTEDEVERRSQALAAQPGLWDAGSDSGEALEQRGKRQAQWELGLGAAALVWGAVGAGLLLYESPQAPTRAALPSRLGVGLGRSSAGVTWRGEF